MSLPENTIVKHRHQHPHRSRLRLRLTLSLSSFSREMRRQAAIRYATTQFVVLSAASYDIDIICTYVCTTPTTACWLKIQYNAIINQKINRWS